MTYLKVNHVQQKRRAGKKQQHKQNANALTAAVATAIAATI